MFRVHEWAEAQRLYQRERRPKAEIARGLNISRTTLDRLLGLEDPPVYERRPNRPSSIPTGTPFERCSTSTQELRPL